MKTVTTALAAVALLSLGACGKKADDAAANSAVSNDAGLGTEVPADENIVDSSNTLPADNALDNAADATGNAAAANAL